MDRKQEIKKIIADDWYVQGATARPLFLNSTAISGFSMKKDLGYGYSKFVVHYFHDYAEGCYLQRDLTRLWQEFYRRFKKDRKYLVKIKQQYRRNYWVYSRFFKKLSPAFLKSLDDQVLVRYFKILTAAQVETVGVSHVIEAISVSVGEKLKTQLQKELPTLESKELARLITVLSSWGYRSFIAQEEDQLLKIMKKNNNHADLVRHQLKYGWWLNNSYAGPRVLSLKDFKEKGKKLLAATPRPLDSDQSASSPKKHKLSNIAKDLVEIIRAVSIWQDERKEIILQNIGRLGLVAQEIVRRTNIPEKFIYNLSYLEVKGLKDLTDLKAKRTILKQREAGSFFLFKAGQDINLSPNYSQDFGKHFSMVKKEAAFGKEELHGQVANQGLAVGRVCIIKNLAALKKIKPGNILVASMTRPEYTSAIKKAAAIITDEGGITCHAAIVSRELGIPAIIGTKVATKVLKNNMLVSVNANHGTVKILN